MQRTRNQPRRRSRRPEGRRLDYVLVLGVIMPLAAFHLLGRSADHAFGL